MFVLSASQDGCSNAAFLNPRKCNGDWALGHFVLGNTAVSCFVSVFCCGSAWVARKCWTQVQGSCAVGVGGTHSSRCAWCAWLHVAPGRAWMSTHKAQSSPKPFRAQAGSSPSRGHPLLLAHWQRTDSCWHPAHPQPATSHLPKSPNTQALPLHTYYLRYLHTTGYCNQCLCRPKGLPCCLCCGQISLVLACCAAADVGQLPAGRPRCCNKSAVGVQDLQHAHAHEVLCF
jgi:hypothetical protein